MRYTQKVFKQRVRHLESCMGVELTANQWHNHVSVYTAKGSACDRVLVQASTYRDACDQITAILNYMSAVERK